MGEWRRLIRAGWVLATGFLALSIFIAAAVLFSVQRQSNDAVVRHALQVEIALADVFSELQDAEIGQRGFLLTGDDAFLEPYRIAGQKIDSHLALLGTLIGAVEDLTSPFAALKARVAEKRAEMASTLSLFQQGRKDEAIAIVQAGSGKAMMDSVRSLISTMDDREDGVVEKRQARVRSMGILVAASITAAVVLLGMVALAAMREVQRRSALARFLPAEVADRLAEGDQSLRHGRETPATIAFVDIRGSTELAERLDVAALSALLTGFRSDVLAAAEAHGGLVDKFMGDGALIVFGVHDPNAAAAVQALAFARDLRARHRVGARGYEIGIGIHHGLAFCGIVGTAERREFTVLGDTVNVAARLEKQAKAHGVDLIVSGALLQQAGEPLDNWQELACDALRGRRARISLFVERGAALIPAVAQSGCIG